jgi:hypothetical protein
MKTTGDERFKQRIPAHIFGYFGLHGGECVDEMVDKCCISSILRPPFHQLLRFPNQSCHNLRVIRRNPTHHGAKEREQVVRRYQTSHRHVGGRHFFEFVDYADEGNQLAEQRGGLDSDGHWRCNAAKVEVWAL